MATQYLLFDFWSARRSRIGKIEIHAEEDYLSQDLCNEGV